MKRFMTIISVLSILAMATSAFGEDYGFTVSGSQTDPFDNAPAPVPGLNTLYLHYVCNNDIGAAGTGMGAYESGFNFSAAPLALNINPVAVFANVGPGPTDLILSMQGCQNSGNWIASWLMLDGTGGGFSVCYRPTTPGIPGGSNTIAAIDCDFPAVFHDTDYIGFDSTGGVPCSVVAPGPNLCDTTPTSVEQSSWGSVKGLYR